MESNDDLSTGGVAEWGERWLHEWIAAGHDDDRENREWVAGNWRKAKLDDVMRWWQQGRDAFVRATVAHTVGNHVGLYHMTGNGLVVWRMYAEYRNEGLPIPEMIFAKFDQWARRLERASGTAEVAAAIEMTGDEGGAQGAAGLKKAERKRKIASDVDQLLRLYKGRMGPNEVFRQVARSHGKTPGAVKALWNRWNQEIRRVLHASTNSATQDAMHRLAGGKVRQPPS